MKRFIFIIISSFIFSFSHAQCLEITSIFVDACTPGAPTTPCGQEGVNEMFTFKTGTSKLFVNDINVIWPSSNSFLNWCRNTGTASSTASLNATITSSCGFLIEPLNDTIPAGANVIVITSTDFCVPANSFDGLTDTMYVIYQCAGNTAGHFANSGSGTRDLIVSVSGPCSSNDIVTYDRSLIANMDGETVLFDAAGNATYVNNGCNAPVITINPDWTFANGGTYNGEICNNYGVIDLTSLLSPNATLGGTWSGPRVIGTNYNPNGYLGLDSVTYSIPPNGTCNSSVDSTIVFNVVEPQTTNLSVTDCDSTLINGVWYTTSQTVNVSTTASTFYGCDSLTNFIITISSEFIDSTFMEACDSIVFNGITYFSDTILRDTVSGGGTSSNTCAELFISEYIEGSGNNKAIEIYNGTGAVVDLSNYTLERYTNGSATSSATINLVGMLADGDVYVVHNNAQNVNAAIVAAGDLTTGSINHNGNDAYSLNKNGIIVDIFGNIGCDPGSEWSDLGNGTADNVLYRLPSYTTGLTSTINPPCTFPSLNASNWVSLDVDDNFSFLGSHTANCGLASSSTCDSIIIVNLKVNTTDTLVNSNNPILICNTNDSVQLSDGTYAYTAGTYYPLSGTNSNGCNTYLTTIVQTQNCNCSVDLGADTTICDGDSLILNATSNNATYSWQDGSTSSTYIVQEQGTFWVDVTANNCTSRDSIIVTFENPILNVSADTTICIGDSVVLSATGTNTIEWNTTETSNDITVNPNSTSTYTVFGTSTFGCISDTATVIVTVQNLIVNNGFSINPDTIINEGESVQIIVNGNNITTYSWSPVNNNTNTINDNPTQTTTYVVTLNNPPCPSIMDSITIIVNKLEEVFLLIPNGFTPNGDGNNEVFRVVNYEDFETYTLKIFNRWGALIFEENAYAAAWDGNYKGQNQNHDSYVYYIDAKPMNGKPNIISSGTITVIR